MAARGLSWIMPSYQSQDINTTLTSYLRFTDKQSASRQANYAEFSDRIRTKVLMVDLTVAEKLFFC